MFIKIGGMLISVDNLDSVKKATFIGDFDGDYISFNLISDNQILVRQDDDYYPQALAAYEFLCKGAMVFDAIPAAASGEREGDSVANNNRFYVVYVERKKDAVYMVWDSVLGNTFSAAYKTEEEAQAEADRLFTAHPQPATPPADSGGEYRVVQEGNFFVLVDPNGAELDNCTIVSNMDNELRSTAHILNTATATLRAQIARLQEDLKAARERVAALEDVIKEAYRIATDTEYETPQLCLDYVIAELREASTD